MQIIDNINHIVKNDLQDSIQPGSKLSIKAMPSSAGLTYKNISGYLSMTLRISCTP